MNLDLIYYYAQLYGIAFGSAVLAVGVLVLFLQIERKFGGQIVKLVFPVICCGIGYGAISSGRDLRTVATNIEAALGGGDTGGSGWVLRAFTLILLGTSAAKVLSMWFNHNRARPDTEGRGLLFLLIFFVVSMTVFSGMFGTYPALSHSGLYAIPIFYAAYAVRSEDSTSLIVVAKWSLVVFMFVGLLISFLQPNMTLQSGYRGWIPGLSIRLWGIGSNPNSVGPLALVIIYLELLRPSRRFSWSFFVVSVALVSLILSQSKTTWVSAIVGIFIVGWYRYGRRAYGGVEIKYVLALLAGVFLAGLAFALSDPVRIYQDFMLSEISGDVRSLSGRSQIWAVAVQEWRNNPAFGYGPLAWGSYHRFMIGLPFAFSAHNQFLQSLSVAGIVGAVAFILYFFALMNGSIKNGDRTGGVTVAIFSLVAIRCISETPFSTGTIFSGEMLIHWLLFLLVMTGKTRFGPTDLAAAGRTARV